MQPRASHPSLRMINVCCPTSGMNERGASAYRFFWLKPATSVGIPYSRPGRDVGLYHGTNLAQQLHMAPIVQLLQLSLGEEENADQLLNQLARPLMSVAKMPESVE